MSDAILERHYLPNWRLSQRHRLRAYNCGYLRDPADGFARHQQNLVWQLLGDTPIGAGDVVLDVGCGIGGPAGWIAERFGPRLVIGLDYCASSVGHARAIWTQRGDRLRFVRADAHRLPVRAGAAAVIVNLESALHYRDKPAFLAECRRALRRDGALCLGDITCNRTGLVSRLSRTLRGPVHLWSAARYRDAFRGAGLVVRRHEDATPRVAAALKCGLREIERSGFAAARGVVGRYFFLNTLQFLLRRGMLSYDLFNLHPRAGAP